MYPNQCEPEFRLTGDAATLKKTWLREQHAAVRKKLHPLWSVRATVELMKQEVTLK